MSNEIKPWIPFPKWVWLILALSNICMFIGSASIGIWNYAILNALSATACGIGYFLAKRAE